MVPYPYPRVTHVVPSLIPTVSCAIHPRRFHLKVKQSIPFIAFDVDLQQVDFFKQRSQESERRTSREV